MNLKVERLARAFYDAQDDAGAWESEFEGLKEQFRMDALVAIALLDEPRGVPGVSFATAGLPETSGRDVARFSSNSDMRS